MAECIPCFLGLPAVDLPRHDDKGPVAVKRLRDLILHDVHDAVVLELHRPQLLEVDEFLERPLRVGPSLFRRSGLERSSTSLSLSRLKERWRLRRELPGGSDSTLRGYNLRGAGFDLWTSRSPFLWFSGFFS